MTIGSTPTAGGAMTQSVGAPAAAPATSGNTVGLPTGREESLANWAGPYVTDMLGRAQALSMMPYQTYRGPLTAGASNLQQQYFSGIGQLGFPSMLGKSFTGMGTQTGADGQPMSYAQQYMNPYMQQVLQPQMQAMQRQADIQRNMLGAQAAQQGAFGGVRSGLMNQQINADLMRQQQQATGQAYGQAYGQAMQQFNTEQQRAQQQAQDLLGAGTLQRGIEQEGITADLNEFLTQRDYPLKQVQFLQSMLQGLPISAVSQSYQQPSGLSQFLGNSGGILGLLDQLGIFKTGAK